ncbi:hypothetical protein JCM24511_02093 [Saitozyma sp. JCM 24511]|nr:hypothetical protein JCM24511_02093 [Saitozyma sp. JCM 24511]
MPDEKAHDIVQLPSRRRASPGFAPSPAVAFAPPAEPTERQKVQDIAELKKRRKTSPGSMDQPERSGANSTAPRPAPAQPQAPHQSNPSTRKANNLAVAVAVRERQREAVSSRATPTHVVEDDAPLLKVLRVGMGEGPYVTLPESYLRSEPQFIVQPTRRTTSRRGRCRRATTSGGTNCQRSERPAPASVAQQQERQDSRLPAHSLLAGYQEADPFSPYLSSHGNCYPGAQEDYEEFETRFATVEKGGR